MASEGWREARVADRVRQELADILANEVGDPRLATVRVLRVQVSGDLQVAWVYIGVSGVTQHHAFAETVDVSDATRPSEEEKKRILRGIASAKGRLRHLVAKRVGLRRAPELRFSFDEAVEEQARIEALLRQVNSES